MREEAPGVVVLDGGSLTLEALARVARDPRVTVACHPEALARVERRRRQIEAIAEEYRRDFDRFQAGEGGEPPVQDYGVTTGFGDFKDIPVAPPELERLQRNLLLSHAVGVGVDARGEEPANHYPGEVVRAALLLRLNTFLKGHSGVRREMVAAVEAMLNRGIVPRVPLHGSVGSSGDLCPLAHLFAVLLGEGSYVRVATPEELAAGTPELRSARDSLAGDLGMEPPVPGYKEGLALVNGTNFCTALLALAVHDAAALVATADVAAALSLEAVCGCARAFDPKVHAARGQRGQMDSAANLRALLAGSRLLDSAGAVQDAYSLRCAPAVHGASRDAVAYARMVVERELNAATDNPLFFPGEDGAGHADEPWDFQFRDNWAPGYRGERRASYSAGNFHGQPLGLAADLLAIAAAELADISERRLQLLLDRHHNRNLPANLIPRRGVNTGLMIVQYTAASLVSENKVLTHPASVDSIPTSANSEDHNSMATLAGRKLRTVVANVQAVLAMELLAAAQAVDWRAGMGRPPRPPRGEEEAGWGPRAAADGVEPEEAEQFAAATGDDRRQAIAAQLGRGTRAAYEAVRGAVTPMVADRVLAGDILAVRRLVASHRLVEEVQARLGGPLLPVARLTAQSAQ